MSLLDEVAYYRGNPTPGGLPLTVMEIVGGTPVPMSNVDVDPMTFRSEYYYNTRRNILYRKITTSEVGCPANVNKVWKAISSW